MSFGGVGAPGGEETWNLLKPWAKLSKLLCVDAETLHAVAGMYSLLCNMYSTKFNAKTLKCRKIARRFHAAIMPNGRSLYFLWLQKNARRIMKNIKPWPLAMFFGDVVESMNAIPKNFFLVACAREGGLGTELEEELRLLH